MTPTDTPVAPAPAATSRRRDAENNRLALLAAAGTVLNRDPDASLDAIAAEAGLSRRALYGHFATRDDLIHSLLAHRVSRLLAAVEQVEHPDTPTLLALIGVVMWREVEAVRVMAQFTVRGSHQRELAYALTPLRDRVRHAVAVGAATGRIRDDIDPPILARLVEGAVLSVLDEATRSAIDVPTGDRLVALSVLGMLGFGAAEAHALIDATPELRS
ncbi:TetR/AcrR family transcriptional regulator [Protaetiibacter intestinalis]|uniref:TetR/AcrR family transcriptional regulator n=1 Tax=Protaetiibacter intestinalis TaxID=2419774 RepID=A0A387B2L3_9MICO|nr:TetR/AcrR family transcriptional regulator [Protaetiibacter intestinalis]AYF97752.1 TetR/AcrR family transcriptional regulator [Protaetiibacter intestinalis]